MSDEGRLSRPVRVCVLTSVHPPFDTRIFHREAKAARDFGCEVTLLAPGAPRGRKEGIRFRSLPGGGGRWARPLRWPVLFRKALRTRADIYHFHDPELLPWGLLLKWVTGAAVVYDSHEYLRENLSTKHWIHPRLRGPLAWFADRVEKWISGRLDAVVAVTEDMAQRFEPYQPRVITLRNLPPAQEIPEPVGGRERVVMYAGLMNRDRGLNLLRETARRVRERHPDVRFEIYGPVEWHGIDDATRALSAEEWAELGVEFKGNIPYQDVGPTMARGMVGWLPRSPHEPNNLLAWPNKLVEYMASGLAIVASDLPTQADVVEETNSGVVVEADSAATHADALSQLFADESRWMRYSANGKKAARTRYTWEAEALKLRTVYGELGRATP